MLCLLHNSKAAWIWFLSPSFILCMCSMLWALLKGAPWMRMRIYFFVSLSKKKGLVTTSACACWAQKLSCDWISLHQSDIRKEFKKLWWLPATKMSLKNRTLRSAKCWDYYMLVPLHKISKVYFCLLGTNGFHVKAKNGRFTAAASCWC